ncbi:MAG: FkbM family methyltransferase [Bacteroidota bacterium]
MNILTKIHSVKLFRVIAKKIFSGFPIQQNFYSGKIFMDAVEHSWAWTGTRSYETFDKELQDKLYNLSLTASKFVDIGSNIGAISLGILLRNNQINVIAIEPNPFAIKYFKKSLIKNKLVNRCQIIEAVVSSNAIEKNFDPSGSVVGHIVSDGGLKVKSLAFWDFIKTTSSNEKLLVKVDIEGFETDILSSIPKDITKIENLTLVFELHPKGLNNVADPNFCVNQLLNSGFKVIDFYDQEINTVNENEFSQIIAKT